MITINVAKDFTTLPGFRYFKDGQFSGEEFFNKILDQAFSEALRNNEQIKIILDGTQGYRSSFLSEAFGLLGNKYGSDIVWNRLILVSNEVPKYIEKIKKAVYERR
jgi:hypothetical protein